MTRSTIHHGAAGGMEGHTADLCAGLAARGHRITVITTRHTEGKTELAEPGIRTVFLPNTGEGVYSRAWWSESALALHRLHSGDLVDVVWSQSIGAYGYLRRTGCQPVLPCVAILHGAPLGEWQGKRRQWGRSPQNWPRLARFALRTVLQHRMFASVVRQSKAVICVSLELADEVRAEFGATAGEIRVVPNGVDAARFAPDESAGRALRSRLGIPDDDFVLLTAGRLEHAKGHHFALHALARLLAEGLPAHLLVAGMGPDEDWLREQAQALGVGASVHWLGRVPHKEMPGVYSAADVVLMLSLLTEAFPYAVVEAMACGRAVVSSRVGGVPTAITHGQNGILVAPGDAEQAAREVGNLLRGEDHRSAMGQAARATVLERFTRDAMVASTEAVFLSCAQRRDAGAVL